MTDKTEKEKESFRLNTLIVACAVLSIAALIPYIPSLFSPPLLDEQFLISWLKNCNHLQGANSLTGLMLWPGPDPVDSWGPLAGIFLYAIQFISGGLLPVVRLKCVFLHVVTTVAVFLVTKKLIAEPVPKLAFVTALLFAVYPLHAEAVSWLGGTANVLATMLFMASLYCYLKVQEEGEQRYRWLIASAALYTMSLASATYMWLGALLVLALEIMDSVRTPSDADVVEPDRQKTFQKSLVRAAPFLVLAGLSLVIALLTGKAVSPVSHFHASAAGALFRNIFFPINQSTWHKYSRAYTYLYVVFAPAGLFTIYAIWRDSATRRFLVIALVWLITATLPFSGTVLYDTSLYGERLLYLASVPFCMLMAYVLLSAFHLAGKAVWHKWVAGLLSCLLVLPMTVFYFCHLWNQNAAYRNAARSLRHIQKSIEFVYLKTKFPYVFARDIPEYVSIYPSFSEKEMICFDGRTQLLSAPYLPEGPMRDALARGKYTDLVTRWHKGLTDLIPLSINTIENQFGTSIEGRDLLYKIRPAIEYYSTARFDSKENCVIMDSNSQAGPAISLAGEGLSNLAGNFFWVDAKILTPQAGSNQEMQFHWMTADHACYEKRDRNINVSIKSNDDMRHRYYIPLRQSGWYSNGPPTTLTLGFPAGARVWLYGVGVDDGKDRLPSLKFSDSTRSDAGSLRYNHPFFNFPDLPELGTIALEPGTKTVSFTYNVSGISGAKRGMIELSTVNHKFNNANGNVPSRCTLNTYPVTSPEGDFNLDLKTLQEPGIYSIRVVGVDASGEITGNFSDSLEFLIAGGEN